MSECPEDKPALRVTATIEILSEIHGLLRFRMWKTGDSAAIARLCREELSPRTFAERLLAHEAAGPALTQNELERWPDVELLEVAVEWWRSVEQWRSSPILVDSLEGFQSATCRRNAEHMGVLALRFPERSAFERLTRDLVEQKS